MTSGGRGVGFDMHAWGRLSIAHSRRHLYPRASSFSCFSYLFFLLRLATAALRLGVYLRLVTTLCGLLYSLRRYGRRPGQPSSSSLARRACVHFDFVFWVFLNYGCAPGPFGDRGDTPRWELMAGTAACCTPYIRCCPFSFPVQPQSTELPATTEGCGGDATSRQDTRQDC